MSLHECNWCNNLYDLVCMSVSIAKENNMFVCLNCEARIKHPSLPVANVVKDRELKKEYEMCTWCGHPLLVHGNKMYSCYCCASGGPFTPHPDTMLVTTVEHTEPECAVCGKDVIDKRINVHNAKTKECLAVLCHECASYVYYQVDEDDWDND